MSSDSYKQDQSHASQAHCDMSYHADVARGVNTFGEMLIHLIGTPLFYPHP
jgi:hypothetical protein